MCMSETITSIEELNDVLKTTSVVLLYFSTNSCSVGEALEPKVKNLITTYFPKIKFHTIDLNLQPEISANYNAFVEPTILVFFEGKETIRKSRNIGVGELHNAILRPYKLIFS